MNRRELCTWVIVILISPFILIPHAIVEWLPADFFYGRKETERYYSYHGQTIRFDEYQKWYVLSYIENNEVVESLSWRYHDMNGPFGVLVFFSDSLVGIAGAESCYKTIICKSKASHFYFPQYRTFSYWLTEAHAGMRHDGSLSQNLLGRWPDSLYRRCCRIQDEFYLEGENRINQLINSEVERRITKNRIRRRKDSD